MRELMPKMMPKGKITGSLVCVSEPESFGRGMRSQKKWGISEPAQKVSGAMRQVCTRDWRLVISHGPATSSPHTRRLMMAK